MAKASKTWKLVVTTIILSLIFITAFVAVFINYIVPTYDITREEIYSILSKVFPILVGLVLIEIATLVVKHMNETYEKLMKQPLQEETPKEDQEFKDATLAVEELKEALKNEQ